jgi:ParB family transcriptional regulator, chromosome partitioning protein
MSKPTSKQKPRLGRGLSALIAVTEPHVAPPQIHADTPAPLPQQVVPAVQAGTPAELPMDSITPNPHQPRRVFDDATIAGLASSLKAAGLIQPIVVRKVGEKYQLIAGERRWRAARLAGFTHIPAIVRDVDALTQAQFALIENIQREDLNPIDRAMGYQTLMKELGLTQAELGTRLGEDRSGIANYLRLLDLAEPVREFLRDGKLSLGHAKILAGIPDILEQQRLATIVVRQELSVRNLERLMSQAPTASATPQAEVPVATTAHMRELEKSLSRQIGLRVQMRASAQKGKGKVVIHYSSLDQFDELCDRLGVNIEAD